MKHGAAWHDGNRAIMDPGSITEKIGGTGSIRERAGTSLLLPQMRLAEVFRTVSGHPPLPCGVVWWGTGLPGIHYEHVAEVRADSGAH